MRPYKDTPLVETGLSELSRLLGARVFTPEGVEIVRSLTKMQQAMKGMDTMNNPPICQFGPGGDYRRVWPKSGELGEKIPHDVDLEERKRKGFSRLAKDLGLEPDLVSLGNTGLTWRKKTETSQVKSVVKSVLDVLRRISPAAVSNEELVSSQIAAADAGLAELPEYESGCCILAQASVPVGQVAMVKRTPDRIESDAPDSQLKIARQTANQQENENAACNTETTRDIATDTKLSDATRLFPDDAGDWEQPGLNKGNRIRTRRSTRKKRSVVTGRQAQRSLFTAV